MGASCSCLQSDNRNTNLDRNDINSGAINSNDGNLHPSYIDIVSKNIESSMET